MVSGRIYKLASVELLLLVHQEVARPKELKHEKELRVWSFFLAWQICSVAFAKFL